MPAALLSLASSIAHALTVDLRWETRHGAAASAVAMAWHGTCVAWHTDDMARAWPGTALFAGGHCCQANLLLDVLAASMEEGLVL